MSRRLTKKLGDEWAHSDDFRRARKRELAAWDRAFQRAQRLFVGREVPRAATTIDFGMLESLVSAVWSACNTGRKLIQAYRDNERGVLLSDLQRWEQSKRKQTRRRK